MDCWLVAYSIVYCTVVRFLFLGAFVVAVAVAVAVVTPTYSLTFHLTITSLLYLSNILFVFCRCKKRMGTERQRGRRKRMMPKVLYLGRNDSLVVGLDKRVRK